jgi:hypothetical protein
VSGLKERGAIREADQRKGGKREGKDEEGAGKEAKTRDWRTTKEIRHSSEILLPNHNPRKAHANLAAPKLFI